MLQPLLSSVREWTRSLVNSRREAAVAYTAFELQELENIFALLLLGSFAGLPSPPGLIAMELLPEMAAELRVLSQRAEQSSDMLAEMVGTLGID
jgi:hypothetical protein